MRVLQGRLDKKPQSLWQKEESPSSRYKFVSTFLSSLQPYLWFLGCQVSLVVGKQKTNQPPTTKSHCYKTQKAVNQRKSQPCTGAPVGIRSSPLFGRSVSFQDLFAPWSSRQLRRVREGRPWGSRTPTETPAAASPRQALGTRALGEPWGKACSQQPLPVVTGSLCCHRLYLLKYRSCFWRCRCRSYLVQRTGSLRPLFGWTEEPTSAEWSI